jgi:hypothetical protein
MLIVSYAFAFLAVAWSFVVCGALVAALLSSNKEAFDSAAFDKAGILLIAFAAMSALFKYLGS